MGSFQRDWSDKVEDVFCEENNLTPSKNNFSLADGIDELGNSYEIKASSSSKFSFNTAANIGQNSLTDYGIFDCISWKEFREKGFEPKKKEVINSLGLKGSNKTVCNVIRDNFKKEKDEIVKLSYKDRKEYITLLSTQNINKENLKTFVLNIILGTCKRGKYKKEISFEEFKKSFFVLINKNKEETILNKYEAFKNINLDNISICFTEDKTSILIVNGETKILRVSFHWKNKFQGGETPCLNVFIENDLIKELGLTKN